MFDIYNVMLYYAMRQRLTIKHEGVYALDKRHSPEQDGHADPQQNGKRMQKREQVTFYLTPEQASKLDDLAYQYGKHVKKRINRNDIVRLLIDHCTIELLDEIKRE